MTDALVELATAVDGEAEFLAGRCESAVAGALEAVGIYVAGDEEMAGNARAAEAAAPDPRPPGGAASPAAAMAAAFGAAIAGRSAS